MGDMAKILRCAAKALEKLKTVNRKCRDTKATRFLVKKNIAHRTLTKMITEKKIIKLSQPMVQGYVVPQVSSRRT